jgi:FkbH-like protein
MDISAPGRLGSILTELAWLPPAAPDFADRVKALPLGGEADGAELQRLATAQLTRGQTQRLARALDRCRSAGALSGLAALRLGVVSNATMDMALDLLPTAALRHRVAVDCVVAPFGQVMQQALDPASQINTAQCDAVLIALDYRFWQLDRPRLADGPAYVEQQAEELAAIVRTLRANGPATVILQSLAPPPEPLFGSFDRRFEGSPRAMVAQMNEAIWRLAGEAGALVLDIEALAAQVGTQDWFDPPAWLAYKMPFAGSCGAIYAEWLARLLGAMRGNARKCLVLDLDNTCWGGVIGDDGLAGIRIGQGHPIGEAHLAVQRLALDLRDRGIILAVASKNFDDVARGPFREHQDMLLRESDIAVFQANWTDKPANLEAIARTLNIGVDALVMLDDNPAERAMIRAALPQVAVPELPADPALFARILSAAGYFEAVSFSDDDRIRVQSYAAEAQRAEVRATTRSLEDYLRSLEMTIGIKPFDARNRARIAQLINKTNQFNLTTRRFSEAEVEAFENDPACVTLQVRMRDRFGDMGMIGVIVARQQDDVLDVVSWLMSCRVLGRKVEEAMLAALVEQGLARGCTMITACYIPTAKNGMVQDLFDRLGLTLVAEEADGVRRYALHLAGLPEADLPMQVEAE